jgi:leucyl aminopeptidase
LRTSATTAAPVDTRADTVALGVFDGKRIPHDLPGGPLQALLDSGEARTAPRALAHTHAGGKRWILVGLGDRDRFEPEDARVAAAVALERARELGARALCWELPHRLDEHEVAAFVEGTLLAAYRFDELRSEPGGSDGPGELVVSDHADRSGPVARAALVARAQNAARRLQDLPPNRCGPAVLAGRARELAAAHPALEAEIVSGRAELERRGMGAFAAVAQGSAREPALIVLRHRPRGAEGPRLGLVGKAVTFDTGGYWLKTHASLPAMKYDMSGGASVLEAVGAIAELGLPVDLVAVVGATDNMVDGAAMVPGDVVATAAGLTVEILNTDAEGRLVLADCLHHAVAVEGAQRLLDLATLTGGARTALGNVHCALLADDDPWCAEVEAAAAASGERVWRLPLHARYAEQLRGRVADLANHVEGRQAAPIIAAEFLHRFTGGVPWAHVDVTAASDLGVPYAAKGGSGWGVRLLVELAQAQVV